MFFFECFGGRCEVFWVVCGFEDLVGVVVGVDGVCVVFVCCWVGVWYLDVDVEFVDVFVECYEVVVGGFVYCCELFCFMCVVSVVFGYE